MTTPDGLLVVDKPADWTSHDVVARCRGILGTKKIGHAGTLDPMATGVLVLGVGRATRLLGHLALTTKAYDATIRLGQSTITDDAMGTVVETDPTGDVDEAAIRTAATQFVGDISQVPSSVSAIKVRGERAYKRVRAGEDVELPPRDVTVSAFEIGAVTRVDELVDVHVRVECSTGTYVRALARDLGAALGVGGHLTSLRRTRVGPYEIDEAHAVDDQLPESLISIDDVAARCFETYVVDQAHEFAVRNGRSITAQLRAEAHGSAGSPVAVMTAAGDFLALYTQHGPAAQALAVFAPA